jgi:hypothetical protein
LTAKDGYFMAKSEMQDAIMRRVEGLESKLLAISSGNTADQRLALSSKIAALEEIRSFVRNSMLWDTRND